MSSLHPLIQPIEDILRANSTPSPSPSSFYSPLSSSSSSFSFPPPILDGTLCLSSSLSLPLSPSTLCVCDDVRKDFLSEALRHGVERVFMRKMTSLADQISQLMEGEERGGKKEKGEEKGEESDGCECVSVCEHSTGLLSAIVFCESESDSLSLSLLLFSSLLSLHSSLHHISLHSSFSSLPPSVNLPHLSTSFIHPFNQCDSTIQSRLIELVTSFIAEGKGVIVTVEDPSIYGNFLPFHVIENLVTSFGKQIAFVIDISQMRITRKRIREYLRLGCLLIVSGSKYLCGPPDSTALMIPNQCCRGLQSLSHTVTPFRIWRPREQNGIDDVDFSIWMRWEGVLYHGKEYFSVTPSLRAQCISALSHEICSLFANENSCQLCWFTDSSDMKTCEPIPIDESDEFSCRTIFPFQVIGSAGDPLGLPDLFKIFDILRTSEISSPCLLSPPFSPPHLSSPHLTLSMSASIISSLSQSLSSSSSNEFQDSTFSQAVTAFVSRVRDVLLTIRWLSRNLFVTPLSRSLDPSTPNQWNAFKSEGSQMIQDLISVHETIRNRPVWIEPPQSLVTLHKTPSIPKNGVPLEEIYRDFTEQILPHSSGNLHPSFFGWVQGGGTTIGMLAEMCSASLNANLGGRRHIAIDIENEVVRWMADAFGYPKEASGLFVTGSSQANLLAVIIARTRALTVTSRSEGISAHDGQSLRAYTSSAAHGCIAKAFEISGLGTSQCLRKIVTQSDGGLNVEELQRAIEADIQDGMRPFLVVGTVGTVDIGAIDDLNSIADVCDKYGIWLHCDAAYGGMGVFSSLLRPLLLPAMSRTCSIALDFHKWGQVPYDAGFLLVRNRTHHLNAFASDHAYLKREKRGLCSGDDWPCDFGVDLSRGFRALKVWFTLRHYGSDRLGEVVTHTCMLAKRLAERVEREEMLEMCAPVRMNVVCFSVRRPNEWINAEIVTEMHHRGKATPSLTLIGGRHVIRAAIVNHRTTCRDVEGLVEGVVDVAVELLQQRGERREGDAERWEGRKEERGIV